MVKYNLTKKLQKSSSPTRSLSPYQLRVFTYFVGFHVSLKRNYGLSFLKVIINIWQLLHALDFLQAILVLLSIFTAKLYLLQTKDANSFVVRWGYFAYYFAVSFL